MLFIGSCAGTFYALDKATGEVKWRYNVRADGDQNNFHGNPLITADLVITGTDGGARPTGVGSIYAFERATGKLRWRYFAGRGVPTSILQLGTSIYAVTLSDELICLDLRTGRLSWAFPSGASNEQLYVNATPVGERNRVFFAGLNGKVYAVDSVSGQRVWEINLGFRVSNSLALSGGYLYVGAANGHIYRLNAKNGDVVADFVVGTETYRPFVLTQDSIITFEGAKTLACLPRSLKGPRWTQRSTTPWSSSQPYLWRGMAVVGSEDGEVQAFRVADGSPEWSYKFTGRIGGIGSDQNVLYIGTRDGTVYAYVPR